MQPEHHRSKMRKYVGCNFLHHNHVRRRSVRLKVQAPQEQNAKAKVKQKTNDEFGFCETIDRRRRSAGQSPSTTGAKCEARVKQTTCDEQGGCVTIDERRCEVKRKRNVAKKSLISQAESESRCDNRRSDEL